VLPELRRAAEVEKKQGARHNFKKFFHEQSEKFARRFAEKCGVQERCAARGASGMLELKSVRAAAGIMISTIYSHALEGRDDVCISDNRDLQHFALASSIAQTFVTEEQSLSHRARRIPGKTITIWNSEQLLANCSAY
jgi:hypothetical protein